MDMDSPTYEKYISLLLKLDDESKSKIIERLLHSFSFLKSNATEEKSNKEKSALMNELYGKWDDKRSPDEIIAEIKSANTTNMEPPVL